MIGSSGSASSNIQRKKRSIGVVAIVLVVLFAVLLFFRILNLIDFLIADLVVGLAANYIFRRLDRQTNR
ncbi:MAG: hypothetical protein ABSF44_05915 [Candidatus Bathyarchaeia archaeon]|jgi:hypothetical protein